MNPAVMDRYRHVLESSVVFAGLEAATFERIIQLGLLLDAKPDDLLVYENMRAGPGLYIVLAGEVEVFQADPAQPEKPLPLGARLNTLGPGQCLGEYSLIDGQTTSASVRALVETKLFFLSRGHFLSVTDSDPVAGRAIYRNLLTFLIERLRHKDKQLNLLLLR